MPHTRDGRGERREAGRRPWVRARAGPREPGHETWTGGCPAEQIE